jgi:hypothetical protein
VTFGISAIPVTARYFRRQTQHLREMENVAPLDAAGESEGLAHRVEDEEVDVQGQKTGRRKRRRERRDERRGRHGRSH